MDINTQPNYLDSSDGNQHDIQILVMDGLEQIKHGKTKCFDEVCDRLEKKYSDATI